MISDRKTICAALLKRNGAGQLSSGIYYVVMTRIPLIFYKQLIANQQVSVIVILLLKLI